MKKLLPLAISLLFAGLIFGQDVTLKNVQQAGPTPTPTLDPLEELRKLELEDPLAKPYVTKVVAPDAKTCALCVSKEYDKVTGETSFYGRTIRVTADRKSGFVINTWKYADGSMSLHIQLAGVSPCITDDATIHILFRDGSRLRINSQGVFNCDGEAVIYFRGVFHHEDDLENLQTKPIETLRVYTYKSSLQEDFTVAQSTDLMNQLRCLEHSAKNAESPRISLDQSKPIDVKPSSQPKAGPKLASITILDGVTHEMKILSKPRPGYTDAARQANTEGIVVLSVTFLASGQIGSITPVKRLPNGLTEQAIAAARRISFEPARKNGVSQTVTKQIEYPFSVY